MDYNLHPSINPESIDFLIAAAFNHKPGPGKWRADFTRDERRITIFHTRAEFYEFDPGEPEQRSPGFRLVHTFDDISRLDFYQWISLLNATGAFTFKELIRFYGLAKVAGLLVKASRGILESEFIDDQNFILSIPTLARQRTETVS